MTCPDCGETIGRDEENKYLRKVLREIREYISCLISQRKATSMTIQRILNLADLK